MLLRHQSLECEFLASFQRRKLVLQFLVFLVLAFFGFFIDSEEAIELQHRPGHAEPEDFVTILCSSINIHRSLIENGGHDLRSHKALPDQLIDLELIFFQVLLDLVGMAHCRSWTNGFVRRLRFLLLFICVRRFRQIRLSVLLADIFSDFLNSIRRHAGRIRTHVGDKPD